MPRAGHSQNSKPALHKSEIARVATEDEVLDHVRSVGLRYVSDNMLGFQRIRRGKGFAYLDLDGGAIRDEKVLTRIRSLVIPPAWTEVWICPLENGHLQATGRDARGRKQHRYHPRWKDLRDSTKFDRMVAFGKALPRIRRQVDRDLKRRKLSREKVLATVVKLLETSLIRVGNQEYARQNDSFGLTTMRDRHVEVQGSQIRFEFRGKSGVQHSVNINDRRLAKIVKSCQELPGQELFQYVDSEGTRRTVDSSDVNEYLREIAGSEFTSKDFRTWAGTVLAARALQEFESFDSDVQAKKQIVRAIESVSKRLGNTKTVCRQCYIHPAILDAYLDRSLLTTLRDRATAELKRSLHELEPEEAAILGLLQQRLKREAAAVRRAG
jgi:DNA topoisomerase-1